MQYNSQGLKLRTALAVAGISKSQYYYKPNGGKPGRNPSWATLIKQQGKDFYMDNNTVVERIIALHTDPDLAYGYHGVTQYLRGQGFVINPKKVYRLMRDNQLLQPKNKVPDKNYAKCRIVQPTRPLEVIEMDLKMVWVERDRRHAFVLNVIDTFTRKWLYQTVAFSITQHQVKKAWEHLIVKFLQPNDLLKQQLHIEIRNDNDKRFSAKMVQQFFQENHLNQVFTHPYTPQENGHVESFHAILGAHLRRFTFWDINQLQNTLIVFQEKYNNHRQHGSIAYLAPNHFEVLWNKGLVSMSSSTKSRKIIFKLKIPRQFLKQHTGNIEPEVAPSHASEPLVEPLVEPPVAKKRSMAPRSQNNTRYNTSPSAAPLAANVSTKNTIFET